MILVNLTSTEPIQIDTTSSIAVASNRAGTPKSITNSSKNKKTGQVRYKYGTVKYRKKVRSSKGRVFYASRRVVKKPVKSTFSKRLVVRKMNYGPYSQNVGTKNSKEEVQTMIDRYAQKYGVDSAKLKRVAMCESGFNQFAVSRGGHMGVFQFAARTFAANSARIGLVNSNPFNAEQNVETAAYMFSIGQEWQWTCKG
jgi:soluble lytic murein transglycosylase-like protein